MSRESDDFLNREHVINYFNTFNITENMSDSNRDTLTLLYTNNNKLINDEIKNASRILNFVDYVSQFTSFQFDDLVNNGEIDKFTIFIYLFIDQCVATFERDQELANIFRELNFMLIALNFPLYYLTSIRKYIKTSKNIDYVYLNIERFKNDNAELYKFISSHIKEKKIHPNKIYKLLEYFNLYDSYMSFTYRRLKFEFASYKQFIDKIYDDTDSYDQQWIFEVLRDNIDSYDNINNIFYILAMLNYPVKAFTELYNSFVEAYPRFNGRIDAFTAETN